MSAAVAILSLTILASGVDIRVWVEPHPHNSEVNIILDSDDRAPVIWKTKSLEPHEGGDFRVLIAPLAPGRYDVYAQLWRCTGRVQAQRDDCVVDAVYGGRVEIRGDSRYGKVRDTVCALEGSGLPRRCACPVSRAC